jgi:hypothetical protein
MTVKRATLDEYSFAAEGMTATSCAAALRRVRSLAETAPAGRAFAAIATLTELSQKIQHRLEASDEALAADDHDTATLEIARAVVLMDNMAEKAIPEVQTSIPTMPAYLKRRRVHFDL